MTAKAVEEEATYKRKNRNHTTSRHRRMAPVPKLAKSRRHGGRQFICKRRGIIESGISGAVSASRLAMSNAVNAAMQLANPAARPVPRSPNASIS